MISAALAATIHQLDLRHLMRTQCSPDRWFVFRHLEIRDPNPGTRRAKFLRLAAESKSSLPCALDGFGHGFTFHQTCMPSRACAKPYPVVVWGTAGRNSIVGPAQFTLNASLGRTFAENLDLRFDATNALNHVTYPSWNTVVSSSRNSACRSRPTPCVACKQPCGGGSNHESNFHGTDFRAAGRGATAAQTPQTTANGTVKFQANTQLVIETVTVKDKNGKPVEGLTAKDFTITEDGVAQTISFCEFQKLDEMQGLRRNRQAARRPAAAGARRAPDRGSGGDGAPDYAGAAGRHTVSRPAADGDVLRHERHAGAGPDPRGSGGDEVHPDADVAGGSDGDPGVQRGGGAGVAGLHGQEATTWRR